MKCKKCEKRFYFHSFCYGVCRKCKTQIVSTHTPGNKVCKKCAEEGNVCEVCGEELNNN